LSGMCGVVMCHFDENNGVFDAIACDDSDCSNSFGPRM
jgi:hypothetical protein